jgi:hypothetical protein
LSQRARCRNGLLPGGVIGQIPEAPSDSAAPRPGVRKGPADEVERALLVA